MMRTKKVIGKTLVNEGESKIDEFLSKLEEKTKIDYSRKFYLFSVAPMGAVRMTYSDKWKTNPNHSNPKYRQRKAVTDYFHFKNEMAWQAKQMKYEMKNYLDALYCVPMPNSWTKKKKEQMNGLPCLSKPDLDNITKAVKDSLKKDDSDVWFEKAEKRWSYFGAIIIYE